MTISQFFTRSQIQGLLKAGDVVLPGTDKSPAFSETGCVHHIDRMAAFLSKDDLDGLRMVLSLFRWTPRWGIALILQACRHNRYVPSFLGSRLRMLELGIKGATLTPYYSNLSAPGYQGQKVFDVMKWDPRITVKDDPPAPDEKTFRLEEPGPEDIRAIYETAREAQPEIRGWGLKKRLEILEGLKEVILENQERILDKVQEDTGKSRFDALTAEIFGVLDFLDYLGKNAVKYLSDRKVPTPFALMGKKSRIYFEPLGTALLVSPWNYPFYQAVVPIAQAFVVGNAVVFKPSSATPLKGLVEDLLAQAGFRPGWVQIVYGEGGRIGDALVDGLPDKIFLIGSQPVGRRVMERAARHLIPVELELGGKDPMIVFEDVNIDRAVAGAMWGAFTTTGQSCTSVERLFVHEDIYEEFKEALVRETLKLVTGTDRDGSADIGAVTTREQLEVIARQVADARDKGAVFLTGGDWDGASRFVPPMVIEGVTRDMLVDREENFGPLLPIYPFASEAEAVELANDPEYGLSASVWADDLAKADRVARSLYTGNVSINNVMLTEGNHALPFGGVRKSGFGRYKGEFGFYSFANIKSVLIDKNSGKMEANWFPYTPRKVRIFSDLTRALYSGGAPLSYLKGALHGLRLEHYVKRLAGKGR